MKAEKIEYSQDDKKYILEYYNKAVDNINMLIDRIVAISKFINIRKYLERMYKFFTARKLYTEKLANIDTALMKISKN